MARDELARRGAVEHDPGLHRRRRLEGLQHLRPGLRQVAVENDLLEIDAELAQQQVVAVEPALAAIEDVVGLEIEGRSRLLLDMPVDHGGERTMVGGDPVQRRHEIVGAPLEHRRSGGETAVVVHEGRPGGAVLRLGGGGRRP